MSPEVTFYNHFFFQKLPYYYDTVLLFGGGTITIIKKYDNKNKIQNEILKFASYITALIAGRRTYFYN